MIPLLAGAGVLLLLFGAADLFAQTRVNDIKKLFAWIAALGGLSLAAMLLLTGRWSAALWALVLFAPWLWSLWRRPAASPARSTGTMTPEEAWQVLGLAPGASRADIQSAYHRLMRTAHPDHGGSDWLAARVNEAREILKKTH